MAERARQWIQAENICGGDDTKRAERMNGKTVIELVMITATSGPMVGYQDVADDGEWFYSRTPKRGRSMERRMGEM